MLGSTRRKAQSSRGSATVPEDVQIITVQSAKELDAFVRFQLELYRDDPRYVPPIVAERREFLKPTHNPFFGHATAAYFLALRDGAIVGPDRRRRRHRLQPVPQRADRLLRDVRLRGRRGRRGGAVAAGGGLGARARDAHPAGAGEPLDEPRLRPARGGLRLAALHDGALQRALLRSVGGGRRAQAVQGSLDVRDVLRHPAAGAGGAGGGAPAGEGRRAHPRAGSRGGSPRNCGGSRPSTWPSRSATGPSSPSPRRSWTSSPCACAIW